LGFEYPEKKDAVPHGLPGCAAQGCAPPPGEVNTRYGNGRHGSSEERMESTKSRSMSLQYSPRALAESPRVCLEQAEPVALVHMIDEFG
jgi:hypothetical protein